MPLNLALESQTHAGFYELGASLLYIWLPGWPERHSETLSQQTQRTNKEEETRAPSPVFFCVLQLLSLPQCSPVSVTCQELYRHCGQGLG